MRAQAATLPPNYLVAPVQALRAHVAVILSVAAAATYPAANRAIYLPFSLPATRMLVSMSAFCTTPSGNYDLGLYDGNLDIRLGSLGSTTAPTGIATWTPATPIMLEAGVRYFAALAGSTTAASWLRWNPSAAAMTVSGAAQQASALALPANAAGAAVASAYWPMLALKFQ